MKYDARLLAYSMKKSIHILYGGIKMEYVNKKILAMVIALVIAIGINISLIIEFFKLLATL